MRFELKHDLPKSPDRAFELLFSEAYEQAHAGRGAMKRTLLEEREAADHTFRRFEIRSDRPLPGFLQKALGGGDLSYVFEERTYPAERRLEWRVIPSKLSDRVKAAGHYRILAGRTEDSSVRVISGEVTVSLPLIGKKIEDFIGGEIESGYEKSTPFAIAFLERS